LVGILIGKGGPEGFFAGRGLLADFDGFLAFGETFFLEALGAFFALDFFAMNIPT
jgi:hypothetical protein